MPRTTDYPRRSFTQPLHMATNWDSLMKKVEETSVLATLKDNLSKKKTMNRLAKSLPVLDQAMKAAFKGDDEELAYLRAMRYMKAYLTVQANQQYVDNQEWADSLSCPATVMAETELIKENLLERYNKLSEKKPGSVGLISKDAPLPSSQDSLERSRGNSLNVEGCNKTPNGRNSPTDSKIKAFLTAAELFQLLKSKEKEVLILDLRDSQGFNSSRIIGEHWVNIPSEKLGSRPMTVTYLNNLIEPQFQAKWLSRHSYDLVVIVDALGKMDAVPKIITELIAMMTEYSEKPTKARPVILEGGFYDFLLHYPQHTTDPNTQLPRPQNQNQRMRIDQIRYPTMHIFRAYEPPSSPELPRKVVAFSEVSTDINEVRWKQTYSDDTGITHKEESTSKMISTYQEHFSRRNGDISKQVVNGDVFKQVLAGPEKSPKLTAAKPTVNRSLKPSGSNHAIVGENSEQPSLLASGSSATDLRDKLRPPETGPNVTIRRGSAESNVSGNESDHGDSAKENVPKILPEVQRDNKPREIATVPAQRPASADYSSKLVSTTKDSSQALFEKTARTRQASPLPGGENSSIPSQPATKKLSSLDTKPSDYILPPVNRVTKPLVSVPPFVPLGPEERTALRKPYSHSTVPRPGFTGLVNLGNTCYLSAVIHCLAHSRPVRDFYLTNLKQSFKEFVKKGFKNPLSTGGKVSDAFAETLELIWSGAYDYFAPKYLLNVLKEWNPMFRGGLQQDGHEAMQVLLDLLHQDTNHAEYVAASANTRRTLLEIPNADTLPPEELAKETLDRHKKISDSPIDGMISFMKESVIQCQACGFRSYTFYNDQILNVWLGSEEIGFPKLELNNLLASTMQVDDSNGSIEWKCPACRRLRLAVQCHYFQTLPRLLIIQLMRFKPNGADGAKIDRFVKFGHTLNLSEYCRLDLLKKQARYRLYAVLDHFGDLKGGHYTASVFHDLEKLWVQFDDQSSPRVFSNPDGVITSAAYVLFFEQIL